MNYVYILRSKKDNNMYTGCTSNLERRVREHNSKKVNATAKRTPLELIFYEAFTNESDAFARERWLKTGWGKTHLQKMLSNTLKNLGDQV